MIQELKPCPFCGGDEISILMLGGSPEYSRVACDNCGASTGRDMKEKVINAWNQRAERTCIIRKYSTFDVFTDEYVCSECGHSEYVSVRRRYAPSRCPHCGLKVVE